MFDKQYCPDGNSLNKSSWDMSHQGRPMPTPMHMPPSDVYGQYFQNNVHSNMGMAPDAVEDMCIRNLDSSTSTMRFSPHQAILGLPGGNSADMMQHLQSSHAGTPLGDDGQVDPMLLAYDGSYQHHDNGAMMQHSELFREGYMGLFEMDMDQDSVHTLLRPDEEDHTDVWRHTQALHPLNKGRDATNGWKTILLSP